MARGVPSPIPQAMRHVPTCQDCDRAFGDVEKALARHLRRPHESRTIVFESATSGRRAVFEMQSNRLTMQADRGRPRGNLQGSQMADSFAIKEQFPDELGKASVAAMKQGYLALVRLLGYEACVALLSISRRGSRRCVTT